MLSEGGHKLEIEDMGLKLVNTINLDDKNEVHTIKMQLVAEDGKEASIVALYRDHRGDYNVQHRKTNEEYKGNNLASYLLEEAETEIKKHLNRESRFYITTNQKSVIHWMKKNGYEFAHQEPDLSREEILFEDNNDIFYENRYILEKNI